MNACQREWWSSYAAFLPFLALAGRLPFCRRNLLWARWALHGASSCVQLAMSSNRGDNTTLPTKRPLSGIRTVLQYTGIPPSWLDKRPKLPSRNWLIFLSVTSSIAGWYFYDRRQCRQIRQEYVDKVKHLAQVPLHTMDLPRKVTVYGTKWPADEEYDRSMKYFRKYVKVRNSNYCTRADIILTFSILLAYIRCSCCGLRDD